MQEAADQLITGGRSFIFHPTNWIMNLWTPKNMSLGMGLKSGKIANGDQTVPLLFIFTLVEPFMTFYKYIYIYTYGYTHVYTHIPRSSKYTQTMVKHNNITSSTAQGGGGSFKNRKPIGEIGCCESGMAERSHWLTERWLELCLLEWLQWLQWSAHPQLLDVVWCTATVVVVVA